MHFLFLKQALGYHWLGFTSLFSPSLTISIQRLKNEENPSTDDDTQLPTQSSSRLALKRLHVEERSSWVSGGVSNRDIAVAMPRSSDMVTPTTFWQMNELVEEHAAWVDDPDEKNKKDYSLKMLVSEFYYGVPQIQSAADSKETTDTPAAAFPVVSRARRHHHHTEIRRLLHRDSLGCCPHCADTMVVTYKRYLRGVMDSTNVSAAFNTKMQMHPTAHSHDDRATSVSSDASRIGEQPSRSFVTEEISCESNGAKSTDIGSISINDTDPQNCVQMTRTFTRVIRSQPLSQLQSGGSDDLEGHHDGEVDTKSTPTDTTTTITGITTTDITATDTTTTDTTTTDITATDTSSDITSTAEAQYHTIIPGALMDQVVSK